MQNESEHLLINPHKSESLILVDAGVISYIDDFRQDKFFKSEAGGILLGYRRDKHLHISHATGPQKGDKRTRFTFSRNDPHHQNYASAVWKAPVS